MMAPPRDTNVTSVLDEAPAFTRQRPGGIFLVIKGPDRGEQVQLSNKPVTFGSAPACDLVLTDKTVSRRHAMALLEGDEVLVRDLGSTNGSFIQGSRFKEITVGFGAEIKLGRTVIKFLPEEEVVEPGRGRGRHVRPARRPRHQDAPAVRAARRTSRRTTRPCSSRARPAPARS